MSALPPPSPVPDADLARDAHPGPTAQRLVAAIRAHPGMTVTQAMESAGIGAGNLYHHLSRLAGAGEIHTVVAGRRRLIYPGPPAGVDPGEVGRAAILRGRTMAKVAAAICDAPGLALRELVERVGESPRVVYYHVKQLRDAGLITTGAPRRYCDLRPGPTLAQLLRSLRDA